MTGKDPRFSIIKSNTRIWAFSSIHSDYKRLKILHEIIAGVVMPGDYFIYMGNIIGMKDGAKETFAEIIDFKKAIQEKFPEISDENFVYLRGNQEEMWQKTLNVHFSDKDDKVFDYLVENGVDGTLKSFGFDAQEGFDCIEKGTVVTSNWTSKIRDVFYKEIGYKEIFSKLKHAAYTEDNALLFVNSGINHKKELEQNKDEFWWGGKNFIQEKPYQKFNVVVRGFAPGDSSGLCEDEHYITVNNKPSKEYNESMYTLFFNENHTLDKAIEI